jgi:hypothetical protein
MIERKHYPIPSKTVFVRGNILLTNKMTKPILDIGAYFTEENIEHIDTIIEGDFTIDDDTETFDNTSYYASGEVTAYDIGGGFTSRYHVIMFYDKAIDDIITSSNLEMEEMNKRLLNRMLFANVYSSMEAFLQDSCTYFVMKNQKYKEKFLKSHDKLSNTKIDLSDIYAIINQIDYRLKNAIEQTVFHRLSDISNLFEKTFDISFPNYHFLEDKLQIRNDIVHRNGHSNDKNFHIITNNQLYELIEETDRFVYALFCELENLDG